MGHQELQPEDIDESISAWRAAFKRTWCAFCDTTSIHGVKYTNDKETNLYIRLIWIIITLVMFSCAIAMVVTVYMEYRSNPTRMNVDSDHAPTSNLLFPPTTVCPEFRYNLYESERFLNTLILPNSTNTSEISGILHYIHGFVNERLIMKKGKIDLLEDILILNKLHIIDFIRKISWNCEDLLFRCRFKNTIIPCNELFQISSTYLGYCCSFNMNETLIKLYNRSADPGLRNGLSYIVRYKTKSNNFRNYYSLGFKILIQQLNTFPSSNSVVKFVPLNEEVFMAVKPMEISCSQAVKDLSFENRLCVLEHEQKLKFFPLYKERNCVLNCHIEYMLKMCNCYTYIFYSNRTNDRICTFKDLPCLIDNFVFIIGRYKNSQCQCHRTCERLTYHVDVNNAPLNISNHTIDEFYDGIEEGYSIVHTYFNFLTYRRVRHDLLSSMVSLVSNLGSAFSLFVGMSMISAVEIIYYFLIILKKFHKQECKARCMLLQKKYQDKTYEGLSHQLKKIENDMRVDNILI